MNDEGDSIAKPRKNTVPTISASVKMEQNNVGLQIVQQKFKQRETVLALFEAYQIIGNEHVNRLLALVSSTGTYAIFSLNVTRLPPETISDLAIEKIFPLNDFFHFGTGKKNSISQLQFELTTSDELPSTFYYYPVSSVGVNDFDSFYAQVISAKRSFEQRQQTGFQSQSHLKQAAIDSEIVLNPTDFGFGWLNDYQFQNEDFLTIDRGIADGTKRLKKGESKFRDELKKREPEFTIFKDYRIYCATWNINGQQYRECPLYLWLSASEHPPDIYAVALQELDLSPKAITFSESRPDPIWNRKIMDNLHKGACYEELTSVRLVGMMLTIFVRKELRPSVIRYKIQTVGTGALNFMGNKGGVAVSMSLNEAHLCFVNSHLAAHLNEVESRNQDFAEINRRCIFEDPYERRPIWKHDHIFWIGDLNYRIEEPPGQRPDYQNFESLLPFDQLRIEMRKGNVFQGYTEGDIKFRPTYKYDIGTDNYDSSEKCRAPAYCDRILWKGDRIRQVTYNSVMEMRQSDHKPVYSEFLTGIKTKDQKLYKRIHEDVLKRVDKYENDNQPQITVEKTDIDFGVVTFNELAIRDFTVANNCHLPVEFVFKPKDDKVKDICEKWLEVEPSSGSLITGTSLSIRIKFLADSQTIAEFLKKLQNSHGKGVFDILVLHVKNGRDIFITIMGEYQPSCFGLPIEVLCQTTRPICEYNLKEVNELSQIPGDSFRVTMPREFFLLIDYLHKMDASAEGAFSSERKFSKSVRINEIRDWLDSWSSEEFPGNPRTAAEALLMFLESPTEPLLKPFVDQLLQTNSLEEAMEYVTLLNPPRRNVFLHLCIFLREGIDKKFYNLNTIATLFGNILLRKKTGEVEGYRDGRCRLLMLRFLQSDFDVFTRTPIIFN